MRQSSVRYHREPWIFFWSHVASSYNRDVYFSFLPSLVSQLCARIDVLKWPNCFCFQFTLTCWSTQCIH